MVLSPLLCWLCTWCESLWNAALHLTGSHVLFTKSTTPHSHTKSIYTHSLRKSLLVLSCLPSDCLWKQMQDNPTDLCWQTHPNLFYKHTFVFLSRWELHIDFCCFYCGDDIFYSLKFKRFPRGDLGMVFQQCRWLQVLPSTWATHTDKIFLNHPPLICTIFILT